MTSIAFIFALHPSNTTRVNATFLRGDYDTAVFQAFKEVEVAVRDNRLVRVPGYNSDSRHVTRN
jgi:hypothetical protein